MHLFYTQEIEMPTHTLPADESKHCVRVLRLQSGDRVHLTDGRGTLCVASIQEAHPQACTLQIEERIDNYGARPYFLHMAVAPTKNMERFEWFVEKATEVGVDCITPLICARSERKDCKLERSERIAVSALKQCKRAQMPTFGEATAFGAFVKALGEVPQGAPSRETRDLRIIPICWTDRPRVPLRAVLDAVASAQAGTQLGEDTSVHSGTQSGEDTSAQSGTQLGEDTSAQSGTQLGEDTSAQAGTQLGVGTSAQPGTQAVPSAPLRVTVLIGPEGDFSPEEIELALRYGFIPADLGPSILRTETAALGVVFNCSASLNR